jgi:hypothetical protein
MNASRAERCSWDSSIGETSRFSPFPALALNLRHHFLDAQRKLKKPADSGNASLGWQWPDPGKRIHSPGAH